LGWLRQVAMPLRQVAMPLRQVAMPLRQVAIVAAVVDEGGSVPVADR
jgi:hypothetical protein